LSLARHKCHVEETKHTRRGGMSRNVLLAFGVQHLESCTNCATNASPTSSGGEGYVAR